MFSFIILRDPIFLLALLHQYFPLPISHLSSFTYSFITNLTVAATSFLKNIYNCMQECSSTELYCKILLRYPLMQGEPSSMFNLCHRQRERKLFEVHQTRTPVVCAGTHVYMYELA